MTSCGGDGTCLKQCFCECYNEDTNEDNEICVCGHREHSLYGYCPSNCCKPVKCGNYKYCGVKIPKWVSNIHKGKCMNCAIDEYGKK